MKNIKANDKVIAMIGPHEGEKMTVVKVESEGARSGWFTCVDRLGNQFLYAGNEIDLFRG